MIGTGPQHEHEKYEELCALATAGVLTPAESEALFTHLNECAACNEMFAAYQNLATDGMDYLHSQYAIPKAVAAFDEDSALARLMTAAETPRPHPQRLSAISQKETPRLRYAVAASVVLAIAAGSTWTVVHSRHSVALNPVPDTRLAQATAEKVTLKNIVAADKERIAALQDQAESGRAEIEQLRTDAKTSMDNLAAATVSQQTAKAQSDAQIAALTQERDAGVSRLHDAEAKYQAVQEELTNLRSQHQKDLLQVASLGERVNTLSATLKDSDTRARDDEQYLSSDKDIRDLIGARSLLIADILDVDEGGRTRKPVGRVFYTQTKSLIFYAYDLDRQPGVKRTSTFQVWGRTSAKDHNPVNLGILYMDSETNRRWTLRVNNPQQLAQLDSLFVTIEPKVQADKPTGKQFLYASLRREPNHP